MLFGKNIDGVLHGIGRDNDAVIGFGVAGMIRLALGARGGFATLTRFRYRPATTRQRSSRQRPAYPLPCSGGLCRLECSLCHSGLRRV